MQVERALLFETPVEMCARILKELRPGSPTPRLSVTFCPFAGANSTARLQDGELQLRVTDLLESAPSQVLEALLYILLSKLYRKTAPIQYRHRYRRFLQQRDIRERLRTMHRARGRKYLSGPIGEAHNLENVFERVNFEYFYGLMAKPELSWSRTASRVRLGHYDPSHHAIIVSRALDRQGLEVALEYVMFHEMLHLRHPEEYKGARRCVHTPAFRDAEKAFKQLEAALDMLRRL